MRGDWVSNPADPSSEKALCFDVGFLVALVRQV